MPIYDGVIDVSIHVGFTVLSYFLKLFWLHRQLGVDVAIVDTYSQALVFLLFPTEKERGQEGSQEESDLRCVPLYIPVGTEIFHGADRVSPTSHESFSF